MDGEDWGAVAFVVFLLAIAVMLVVGIGSLIVDGIDDRRSFDAQVACQMRRMEAKRKYASTHVVCVPLGARQDTTTVNVR